MVVAWLKQLFKKLNSLFILLFKTQYALNELKYSVFKYFEVRRFLDSANISSTKPNMYRFFLLNQLYKKNLNNANTLQYFLFRVFNSSNTILKQNSFLWWTGNKRLEGTLNQTTFYKNVVFNFNNKNSNTSMANNFLIGFRSVWLSLRFWIIPVYLGIFAFMYQSFLRSVSFNILTVKCIMLFGIFYWLFSGFVFFLKKYQYRYFTASLQRFWKRCYAIFWMLELFTLSVFLYFTMMASQEPFYMYDNAQIFKTHLFSWRYFMLKMFPVTLLIMLTYFVIMTTKWTTISKTDLFLTLITLLLVYISWLEFYQFFHVISYYGNFVWKINDDTSYWFLESELKRTRISNHFLTICLIAKFWHLVFALVFWMFFVLKSLEVGRVRYPLLVANYQNFIFVYILSWLYMFPWVKYACLKLMNTPYYWFFVNNKRNMMFFFVQDAFITANIVLNDIVYFVPNCLGKLLNYQTSFETDFFYWHTSAQDTSYSQYRKNYVRDVFVRLIN